MVRPYDGSYRPDNTTEDGERVKRESQTLTEECVWGVSGFSAEMLGRGCR